MIIQKLLQKMARKPFFLITMAVVVMTIIVLCYKAPYTVVQNRITSTVQSENLDGVRQQSEIELQRNQLSALLNSLQEKHQKLVCTTKQQGGTSETGGWCNHGVQTEHKTDVSLAKGLAELMSSKTVIGLGDGPGKYRSLLLDSGAVKQYDAYDGAPNIANITGGQVSFLDLTLPQFWLPAYDWVVILEVMEHIPAQYENVVLDNVARLASRGVVLSWAVTGQPGYHHINCRPPEHVLSVLKQRGFDLDSAASIKLQQAASMWWLKNNVKVFRRPGVS